MKNRSYLSHSQLPQSQPYETQSKADIPLPPSSLVCSWSSSLLQCSCCGFGRVRIGIAVTETSLVPPPASTVAIPSICGLPMFDFLASALTVFSRWLFLKSQWRPIVIVERPGRGRMIVTSWILEIIERSEYRTQSNGVS
jgi:hypothetical protein